MGAVYRAHIHGRGWTDMAKDNTYVNGPKDTYVTAVAASLENQPEGMTGTIAYQVNLSGSGWMDWQENLGEAGATDTDKPLEAVRMPVSYTHLDVYKRQGLMYDLGGGEVFK